MRTELRNEIGIVYMTSEFDAANKWIYSNWIGSQTYAGIVAGGELVLRLLQKYPCHLLLNDNRLVYEPWNQGVEWAITNWAPRAVTAGLTHFAQVVSPESIITLSPEDMYSALGEQMQMQTFISLSMAQEWLHQAKQ